MMRVEVAPAKVMPFADGCFYDFGRDAFGQLEFALEGKGGETVEICIGECVNDNRINREPGGFRCFKKMELVLKPGMHFYQMVIPTHKPPAATPSCVAPAECKGEIAPFRYAEICYRPDRIKMVRQIAYFDDFNDNASHFESDNADLNELWDFCKYSIKATNVFGMYVDGERERLPYEGDAYINQLGHFCCDANYQTAKKTIEYFFTYPTWPTEWVLMTPILVRDYLLYSGDQATVNELIPKLEAKLLLDRAGEDLLIRPDDKIRDIVDWPLPERDGYEFGEVNFVPNCYHVGALNAMYELTGDVKYLNRAQLVKASLRKLMLKNGLFVDSPASSHTALHSSVFSVFFGIAGACEFTKIAEQIRSRGMACSVFGAQFLLESVYMLRQGDYALKLMLDKSLRSWFNMISKGSTISMEAWDDTLKPNQDWNHAWGAAPANVIPRFFCGIRPTQPGFREFVIDPQNEDIAFYWKQPTVNGDIILADGQIVIPPGSSGVYRGQILAPGKHKL